MSVIVDQPYPYFFEKDKSRALFNASIYIGVADTDPEFNLKVVVGVQEDGSEVPLNQPLRTNSGGGITYNGSPIRIKVDPPYSMKVLNNKGAQEYYWPCVAPDGSAPTIGATITENVTLTNGQTTVNLTNQLNGYISVRVNGYNVDDSTLVSGVDYNQVNQTQIALTDSYPAGSILTVVQNDLSGDSKGPVNCYETVSAAESASLAVGTCFKVQEIGGASFIVRDLSYVALLGDITIENNLVAEMMPTNEGYWSALWFGVVDDPDNNIGSQIDKYQDASTRAALTSSTVLIPSITSDISGTAITDDTTWIIAAGVKFNGVPGISPSFPFDLTNLGGRIKLIQDPDKFGIMYVGDPSYKVQAETGRSQTTGAVVGASDTGQNGVGGYTHTSAKDSNDQGSIGVKGVALNDQTDFGVTTWAAYFESIKDVGVDGIALTIEAASVNKGDEVTFLPPTLVTNAEGLTASYWGSAGIGEVDDTNSSIAMGFIGQPESGSSTAKYLNGIVFQEGSVANSGLGENYLCLPKSGHMAWWDSRDNTGQKLNFITGADGSVVAGRLTFGCRNSGADTFTSYRMNTSAFDYSLDQTVDIGQPSFRFEDGFFVNTPTGTSDKNDKEQIRDIDEALKNCALLIKPKMWKWKKAAKEKGDLARWHIGPIAQEVQAVFEDAGINPFEYGFIGKDEILDSQENPTGEYRMNIRATELQWLILSAMES